MVVWRELSLPSRVARAAGWDAELEPSIPGSGDKGDVLLTVCGTTHSLVEVTTLSRTNDDLLAERFEDALRQGVHVVEYQHDRVCRRG